MQVKYHNKVSTISTFFDMKLEDKIIRNPINNMNSNVKKFSYEQAWEKHGKKHGRSWLLPGY